MTMRARANRWEPQRRTRSSSPGVLLSHLGGQRRTSRRAIPPNDPVLRAFLEEVGRMAADAVLERMRNSLNAKDCCEDSIKSLPRPHRSGVAPAERSGHR